jgi:hypothetical protein
MIDDNTFEAPEEPGTPPENITQFVPGQEKYPSFQGAFCKDPWPSDLGDTISGIKASEEAGQEAFPSAPVPDLAPDSVEYVTLHPDFDAAMLGPSVHPSRPTVAVYSIELLLAIVMSSELVGREMALMNIRTMMEVVNADLKERAPVFVDDYEFVKAKKKASDEEGPKIIV